MGLTVLVVIVVLVIMILSNAIRVLREYERGVIFRLGRMIGVKGPGLILLIPIVDKMERISTRIETIDVQRQEVMTRDNVPVTVANAPIEVVQAKSTVAGYPRQEVALSRRAPGRAPLRASAAVTMSAMALAGVSSLWWAPMALATSSVVLPMHTDPPEV